MIQPISICQTCNGRRHVWTPEGWSRCACILPILATMFVKPEVRGAELVLPEQYRDKWLPLIDCALLGDPLWRYPVWSSLEHYAPLEPTYECVDINHLGGIFYTQDDDLSPKVLYGLDLLILTVGEFFVPNKTLTSLVGQLLTQRRLTGRPTWAVSPFNPAKLRRDYPPAVVELLVGLGAAKIRNGIEDDPLGPVQREIPPQERVGGDVHNVVNKGKSVNKVPNRDKPRSVEPDPRVVQKKKKATKRWGGRG